MQAIITEQQAEALGFEYDTEYPHDQWHISRYKHPCGLQLEFTFQGQRLDNITLDIPETMLHHINLLTLVTITEILDQHD